MWIGEGVWAAAWPKIAFTNSEVSQAGGKDVDCNDDNDADDNVDDDDFSNALLAAEFWLFDWVTSEGAKDGIEEEGDKEDGDNDDIFLHISAYGLVDRTGEMYKSDSQ